MEIQSGDNSFNTKLDGYFHSTPHIGFAHGFIYALAREYGIRWHPKGLPDYSLQTQSEFDIRLKDVISAFAGIREEVLEGKYDEVRCGGNKVTIFTDYLEELDLMNTARRIPARILFARFVSIARLSLVLYLGDGGLELPHCAAVHIAGVLYDLVGSTKINYYLRFFPDAAKWEDFSSSV